MGFTHVFGCEVEAAQQGVLLERAALADDHAVLLLSPAKSRDQPTHRVSEKQQTTKARLVVSGKQRMEYAHQFLSAVPSDCASSHAFVRMATTRF